MRMYVIYPVNQVNMLTSRQFSISLLSRAFSGGAGLLRVVWSACHVCARSNFYVAAQTRILLARPIRFANETRCSVSYLDPQESGKGTCSVVGI